MKELLKYIYMKKQLIFISALFISLLGFSQGIQFEHGTWKEVLEKAKQTNKPLFIDVYTSWCGPCKKMSKDIFPLAEVGKVYNENFVCYQVDAEKGEGIDIARKYEVKAFPTYLFVKSDGTLFYTAIGSREAKMFIVVANNALTELKDPKTIAVWDKEYLEKKDDPAFILNYMNKRSILGLPNASLFDEYLKLLPEGKCTSDTVADLYRKEGDNLRVNTLAYKNMQKNKDVFQFKLFASTYNNLLSTGVINTVRDASKSKNEQLLADAMKAYDQIPEDPYMLQKDELYMEYYKRTGEIGNYVKYATDFCDSRLMNMSKESIDKKDSITAQIIEKQISSGALASIDSTALAQLKKNYLHVTRDQISQKLNNIAWEVFGATSDKDALQKALGWSKRSLELFPENSASIDTYANLLYKLGQKEEAISKEEEALKYADQTSSKGFQETIEKMKAGK
jgi:thioredoxin-related protein